MAHMQACFPLHISQYLDKRDKEGGTAEAHTWRARLHYGARLYRLLAAMLLAATPVALLPGAASAVVPPAVAQLRRLADRMGTLAAGSCLALHRAFTQRQRAEEAKRRGQLQAADYEEDPGAALVSRADVRQRLKVRRGRAVGLGDLGGACLQHRQGSCCILPAPHCTPPPLFCRAYRLGTWAACGACCWRGAPPPPAAAARWCCRSRRRSAMLWSSVQATPSPLPLMKQFWSGWQTHC